MRTALNNEIIHFSLWLPTTPAKFWKKSEGSLIFPPGCQRLARSAEQSAKYLIFSRVLRPTIAKCEQPARSLIFLSGSQGRARSVNDAMRETPHSFPGCQRRTLSVNKVRFSSRVPNDARGLLKSCEIPDAFSRAPNDACERFFSPGLQRRTRSVGKVRSP